MSLKIAISINLTWPLNRFHDLYNGIQSYAKKHTDWNLVWDHYPEIALSSSDKPYYDGIIGRIKYDAYEEAKRLNIPMVNNWLASTLTHIPSVHMDHYQSGVTAAEHLLKRGFENFVSIDNENDPSAEKFNQGVADTINKFGYKLKKYYICRKADLEKDEWKEFYQNFSHWVKEWQFPVAICTSMSVSGPRISTRLMEHGINIPTDAALISAGNEQVFCEKVEPQISSVEHDYFKVGFKSAQLLDAQLKGITLDEEQVLIQPGRVVPRVSTDTYVMDDPYLKRALRFIADNYQNNIQSHDVIHHISIGRRAIETRFRKMIGHSIMDEINRQRLSKIKQLLLDTNENIKILSVQAGFSNASHMRRMFARKVGMSPMEFRKMHARVQS